MSAFPADEVRSKRVLDPVDSMTGCLSPSSKEEARRKNEEALAAAQRAMLAAHNDVKADNEIISIIRKISDTKVSTTTVVRRTSGTQSPATIHSNNGEASMATQTSVATEVPVRRLSGTSLINAIRGNSSTKISGENSNNTGNPNITGERKSSGTSLINALRGNSNTNIEAPKKLSNTSLQSQLLGFNKWF